MQSQICMSIPIRQAAPFLAPPMHPSLMPLWLIHLGALGLFFVAVVDSSPIPLSLPGSTDLLLLWLVAYGGDPWLLAALAIAGSLVGGYSTWHLGAEGAKRHCAITCRRVFSVGLSDGWSVTASLPYFSPHCFLRPFRYLPFALASGALGVSRRRFLLVYGSARTLRYSLIAWLGVVYGRHAIRMWSGTFQKWSIPLIIVFVGLLIAGTCFGIWKVSGLRKIDAAEKLELHDKATEACATPEVA